MNISSNIIIVHKPLASTLSSTSATSAVDATTRKLEARFLLLLQKQRQLLQSKEYILCDPAPLQIRKRYTFQEVEWLKSNDTHMRLASKRIHARLSRVVFSICYSSSATKPLRLSSSSASLGSFFWVILCTIGCFWLAMNGEQYLVKNDKTLDPNSLRSNRTSTDIQSHVKYRSNVD